MQPAMLLDPETLCQGKCPRNAAVPMQRGGVQGHPPTGCHSTSGFDQRPAVTARLVPSWWSLLKNACGTIRLLGEALPGKEPGPKAAGPSCHPACGWHAAGGGQQPGTGGRGLGTGTCPERPKDGWLDRQTPAPPASRAKAPPEHHAGASITPVAGPRELSCSRPSPQVTPRLLPGCIFKSVLLNISRIYTEKLSVLRSARAGCGTPACGA